MTQLTFSFEADINRTHAEAQAHAAEAKVHITAAVQKALECGQWMRRQKESLLKSDPGWIDWLADHCPGIDEGTARRYLAIAKQAPLDDAVSSPAILRQAYLATGLLSESPKAEHEPDSAKSWVKFVKPLDQFRLWFHNRCDQSPMSEWGEDALRLLSNELRWFLNLHAEIQREREKLAETGNPLSWSHSEPKRAAAVNVARLHGCLATR